MSRKIETGLIVIKEDVFTKIKKNIFAILFKEETRLLNMLEEIQRPRNKIEGKIIIPKEIKRK